ncbi:MAG: glycoside hydrolase family 3 N-terminal domain-containing protein [Pyrinomonadaceae bacterium]
MERSSPRSTSLEEKIGQLLFIGLPGPEIDVDTERLLADIRPGGVCLFARNIRSPEQTRELLDGIRDACRVEPFLSVDQEGGLVDRLRRILAPMPAASKLSSSADAREIGRIIADALTSLGFNMDFAPVVDVVDENRAAFVNGLHSRAFGRSAVEVTEFAGEFLSTLQSGGIIGCIKHFPGLGASEVDSHEELPLVSIGQAEFDSVDLTPYRELIATGSVRAVMVAHAAYPKLELQETGQNGKLLPSSLSSNFVTKLLRHQIGFDGLVLTDDLEMGAIIKNYGIGEAAVMSIEAGCDMACICAGTVSIREAHAALLDAAATGRLSEDRIDASVDRIFRIKQQAKPPAEFLADRVAAIAGEIARFSERLA